jgi:dihydroorotate dehydrogenase (fumarate)
MRLLYSQEVININIEGAVMIGAGPIKTVEDVTRASQSKADVGVVGSITIEERSGNPGITYYVDPDNRYSINSKGLPNPGYEYYKKSLPEMVRIAHDRGKLLIVSVAGFTPYEYARLSEMVSDSGADGQELNLGCPNVWGPSGRQKRIVSFDIPLIGKILELQQQAVGDEFWTTVKPSPYSDPTLLAEVAEILSGSKLIKALTICNTFPNAFTYTNGKAAISFGSGLAGMAGEAMRPIVTGQIKQFRQALPGQIAIIAVGGITERVHIDDYRRAGAVATQVVTAYINEGPEIFDRLCGDMG